MMHVDESVLDANGQIDPDKLATVGRMGGMSVLQNRGSL